MFKRIYLERKSGRRWRGSYPSWDDAARLCTGYDSEIIFSRVKDAALKVKEGEGAYERDAVVFQEPDYCWQLVRSLLAIAKQSGGVLRVLDYGGSLGSTYFKNRVLFSNMKEFHWSVVEQPPFVHFGREHFADENLDFFESIPACLAVRKPTIALFSAVLGYLSDPAMPLALVKQAEIPNIVIDRTGFMRSDRERITIQRVGDEIYPATYPFRFLSRTQLQKLLAPEYGESGAFTAFDHSTRFADFLGMTFYRKG